MGVERQAPVFTTLYHPVIPQLLVTVLPHMKASARMTVTKAEAETRNGHRVLTLFKRCLGHTEHNSITAFPWLGYMNK